MVATVKESPDFLVRGSEYLADRPDFKLIGRKDDLNGIMDILLRKSTGNNLVLHGNNGAGLSSLVLGLQSRQLDDDMPLGLATKEFYYLDVDGLFSSNDPNAINAGFKAAMETLKKSQNPVLIIDDTKGFLDGLRNSGANNLMNLLMRAAKTEPRVQIIFESANAALQDLFSAHSDITKLFTLRDVNDPAPEDLRAILDHAAEQFAKEYDITVSKEAVDQVMDLTKKYPGLSLDLAQPKRSIVILEGALASYVRAARARPAELDALEEKLAAVTQAIESGNAAGDLAGKTKKELAAVKLETENTIKEVSEDWTARKTALSALREDQIRSADELRNIDRAIAEQAEKEKRLRDARKAYHDAKGDDALQQQIKADYKLHNGEDLLVGDDNKKEGASREGFNKFAKLNIAASKEIEAFKKSRKELEAAIEENKQKYADLLQESGGGGLALTDEHVLAEFSRLSHVPMNKLKQDESQKLLHLADMLKERVFGQDEPIEAVAKAVKRGRVGLKKPNKPIGSFLFLGPSGVGKTELAKALAAQLFGDESALQIYNMSEYMEKHASAVLIGAPPGYEGHAEGGLLTNNMRRMPYCVNVFDEAEKADKQVFDLFLQIIDEGTLVDRRGVKASFANSINILTSNVGAKYFLDENLTFEEAKEKALADLWNPEGDPNDPSGQKGFRPEFLNRFTGIFCFNRLGQVEIIKIANKSLKELNQWVAEDGISVSMPDKDLDAMCKDQYDPKNGGRGIMNYIENKITSDVADALLRHPGTHGTVEVTYTPTPDKKKREDAKVETKFITAADTQARAGKPVNENTPPAANKKSGPKAG